MQAMQYNINLPADYDMGIIKKRVTDNGFKTDAFPDLLFKAYLITEKANGDLTNSYRPLYLWKQTEGMTTFIFDGYFDGIIQSFGWQSIEIGITYAINLTDSFANSHYVLEEVLDIPAQSSLTKLNLPSPAPEALGQVIIYNPDKWKWVCLTFFESRPLIKRPTQQVATILHLSFGD